MAFNILRAARAVVQVTDLDAAREFYVDALGFIETESDGEHLYLRGLEEHNHHSCVLKKASKPGIQSLGYKVFSEKDLESLSSFFESKGMKLKWLEKGSQHAVGRAFRVQDPSGIPLEFFAEMETVERMLQRYDLYRGAHMQRISTAWFPMWRRPAISTFNNWGLPVRSIRRRRMTGFGPPGFTANRRCTMSPL
ncbi:glyoxalase/bleomycin resistance protein/dioxygenase superfamily protein [Melghirimyces profundicolus]|uniref:Glyoxalase/bleomycin resistance protein/dioxygenase superfamily protein n=1 Tax=Melghirimyces profundicolus TaxID=1242148 RepID=A0A2T6C8F5_9BACL|nr:glyoxalase/bleomycin resistance protein/dioxygenase superfamily protein [Melghirimyces profundicolus]